MDNVKTITAREIKQIASTFYEQPKYIMWHGKRIRVNPLLSFKETFEFISSVISMCTKQDENILVAESVDFIFKKKTLEKYGGITLPDDIEEQYKVIYGTDLVQSVWNEINRQQLLSLKEIIRVYTGITII